MTNEELDALVERIEAWSRDDRLGDGMLLRKAAAAIRQLMQERDELIGRPIPLTEWQKMELQLATVTKERDGLVEALKQFAECDLNDGNCASLEVATRRIRSLAQAALAKLGADKTGEQA